MLISIGFEIETQFFSPVQRPHRKFRLRNPVDYIYQIPFDKSTYLYPDDFTETTAFYRKALVFWENQQQRKHYTLTTSSGESFTIETSLKSVFRNTEFVVTYPKLVSIDKKKLLIFLYTKFRDAVNHVQELLSQFDKPINIEGEFPYPFLSTHPTKDLLLLCRKESLSDAQWSCQTTMGIPLEDAMDIFLCLAKEFQQAKQTSFDFYSHIVEIQKLAKTLSNNSLTQNYLFLFLYSFKTTGKRKTGVLFNVRHAFRDIWKYCITTDDRKVILEKMVSLFGPTDDTVQYFEHVHFRTLKTRTQKLQFQDLEKVGTLPFRKQGKIFFFEFRGFSQIVNEKCCRHLHNNSSHLPRTLERLATIST